MNMYYFHPFGSTGVDNICDISAHRKHNYTIFFDQEPIDLARHAATFDHISELERDITGPDRPRVVVSEKNSTNVKAVCDAYDWESVYYFFHGWAALDWYRGYDKSHVYIPPSERAITHTFMSPNRIIGGDRWHRVIMMYHYFRLGLTHNHISMPEYCPVEQVNAGSVAKEFSHVYPDMLPMFMKNFRGSFHMPGEQNHPMSSYRLDLWDVACSSMLYVVTETVAQGHRLHLTEKIFKPIAMNMPFMLVSTQGSLEYLRSYGFQTFGDFWNEDYDQEPDIFRRMEKITSELHRLDRLSLLQKRQLWRDMLPVMQHNHEHFYGGGFEQQLDQELKDMLCRI